jgi:hypothetical protein
MWLMTLIRHAHALLKPLPLEDMDLNLLVALDALLAEESVTRAAGRCRVTQSAMSHSLAKLRVLLGDDLLIRTPSGMAPPRGRWRWGSRWRGRWPSCARWSRPARRSSRGPRGGCLPSGWPTTGRSC